MNSLNGSTGLRAAGLLIFRKLQEEIQYLLMQTSYGEHHWTPPKGHVDPGESDEETAWRETQEESGLLPEHLTLIPEFKKVLQYTVRGKPKTVIYWLAELKDVNTPIILSSEHQDFKWLPLKDALIYANYPDLQQVMKDADEFLRRK